MNSRKYGIPLTISRKAIKLETSHLARDFDLALPTIWNYNIPEKMHGLGHVTRRIFLHTLKYISKTGKAREFKTGTQLHLVPSHKSEVQYV